MRVRIERDKDWFAASGELVVDELLKLDMLQLMDFVSASPSRFVQVSDGRFLALTEQLRKRVLELAAYGDRRNNTLRIPQIRAAALMDLDEWCSIKSDKHWKACLKRIRQADEIVAEVPSTLNAELRDYQIDGFRWLCRLAHWGAGACLADDMGLGKTLQAIALLLPTCELPGAKLTAFAETIDELLENKHKALVFSQFVDHLAILRAELDRRKVTYQYLDGSTPIKERQRSVEAFQNGLGDVFLISLKAGGTGLNLTAADYVLHMDPWWNPAVEDQAADRAYRMGQLRPVTIYRFITLGTIEEKILALHGTKRDLADSLLEGTDTTGRLSAEELLALIQ